MRSKTTKPELKNCPTEAQSAGVMLQRLVTDKILVKLMIKKQKEICRLKPKPSEAEPKKPRFELYTNTN